MNMWDATTRQQPIQRVRDVADMDLGRVPLGLSQVISQGFQHGYIASGVAFYTGHVLQDGPMRGGGPKLQAAYLLEMTQAHLFSTADDIHVHLRNDNIFL